MRRTTIVKKALKEHFPNRKISVTKGTGTASGWINITMNGKSKINVDRNDVEEIAIKALQENNQPVYYFDADDGGLSNRRYACISISTY